MTRRIRYYVLAALFCIAGFSDSNAQDHSIARQWSEVMLEAIRGDYARPTVHARNLFHASAAMYDAWAIFDDQAKPFFVNRNVSGYENCVVDDFPLVGDLEVQRHRAISFAAYRVLRHRFFESPSSFHTLARFDSLFTLYGYNRADFDADYSNGSGIALGNYIGNCIVEFGLQDGANEAGDYRNQVYNPVNPPLVPNGDGNPRLIDPNRWQALSLEFYVDQSGNPVGLDTLGFLSPEWGRVTPFAMGDSELSIKTRDDIDWWVYNDPGAPPLADAAGGLSTEEYVWGFCLVSMWSSQLDPSDGVMMDISPASIGNNPVLPSSFEEYRNFYKEEGGDASLGWSVNPSTGMPYETQMVPRGDFARAVAEFWADGPDSETPPGHWFTLLNYVNDHPDHENRFKGEGDLVDQLEWDVKSYLLMGGTMHDAAISAWSNKGYYDYIRPISALRAMAERGQSTDPNLPSYSPDGIQLIPGYIEVITESDSDYLRGPFDRFIGDIKVKAWSGVLEEDHLNKVDWIRAANWWPYQRPSFVTPPFAGYVSGHSTFSRAAAEVMTSLTGDEYFPGGMGEYVIEKNNYLVFEEGPSVDMKLQWATYRDASDQASLSRIWGGIHPPADDIPGRLMGIEIGQDAFLYAREYFLGNVCVDHRQISETLSMTTTHSADSLVHSNALLLTGSNVEYHAGQGVCLEPGFEVDLNVDFYAHIDSCQ